MLQQSIVLVDRGYLVTEGDHKALLIPGHRACLGKHVLDDDISFKVAYLKLSSRICQGNVWMLASMQGTAGVASLSCSPVIEEEVVQKASPGS